LFQVAIYWQQPWTKTLKLLKCGGGGGVDIAQRVDVVNVAQRVENKSHKRHKRQKGYERREGQVLMSLLSGAATAQKGVAPVPVQGVAA
jgi:hypothetical protein